MDRKIEDVESISMKLIYHKPNHFFSLFSHHAGAISLAQGPQEIFLLPGGRSVLLEGLSDAKHLGHISSNHPSDVGMHFALSEVCAHKNPE